MEGEGLATYLATQGQNTTQHYYAGGQRGKGGKKMGCKKKGKGTGKGK